MINNDDDGDDVFQIVHSLFQHEQERVAAKFLQITLNNKKNRRLYLDIKYEKKKRFN